MSVKETLQTFAQRKFGVGSVKWVLYKLHFDEGLDCHEVAGKIGLETKEIRSWFEKYHMPVRLNQKVLHERVKENGHRSVFSYLRKNDKSSLQSMAKEVGVSRQTLRNYMDKLVWFHEFYEEEVK